MRPMPLYGVSESSHWMIKNTSRRNELTNRLNAAQSRLENDKQEVAFLTGALDDLKYQMDTWGEDREGMGTHPSVLVQMPVVDEEVGKAQREIYEKMKAQQAKPPRKPRKKK